MPRRVRRGHRVPARARGLPRRHRGAGDRRRGRRASARPGGGAGRRGRHHGARTVHRRRQTQLLLRLHELHPQHRRRAARGHRREPRRTGRSPDAGIHQVHHAQARHRRRARATKTEATSPRPRELKYEETDGHNHWHFQRAARYSLWNDGKTDGDRTSSSKVGFCFLDIGHGDPSYWLALDDADPLPVLGALGVGAEDVREQRRTNCTRAYPCPSRDARRRRHRSGRRSTWESARGWRDVYERTLPFQYVDVSRHNSPATTGCARRWIPTT